MSKALKSLGFKYVGPTLCYSMMQSSGLVIDHLTDTPELKKAVARSVRRHGGYQDRRKKS
jgi:DNA-3-methyladenine glycosylase I